MSSRNFLRALLATSALCAASPAMAQLVPPAPVRQSVDSYGVDLFLGTPSLNAPAVSMGGAEPQGLSYYPLTRGAGWTDNVIATINSSGSTYTVTFGGASDSFTSVGGSYTSTEGNGASLTLSGSIYTYIASDGTIAHFDKSMADVSPYYANVGRVTDIARPNGQKLKFNYLSHQYCSGSRLGECIYSTAFRIDSIVNGYGYSMSFQYQLNDGDINWTTIVPGPIRAQWGTVIGAVLANKASISAAALSENLTTVTSGSNTYFQVTDPLSRVTKYRMSGAQVVGITYPGGASEDVTFVYGATGRVSSVTTAAGTVSYASSDAGSVRTVTVTDPVSHARTYTFDIPSQRMTSRTDALGHMTSWQYDTSGRITRVTQPEGNYTQLTYDARGNLTESRAVSKTPGTPPDIVTSASFDATCTNGLTCNQPNTTTDANGNVTNYTYDPTHGGVLTKTLPAPTTGAVRPQTRYSYTALQAYYSNGTSIVASGVPVYLLTGTSTCQTTASCTGTAGEVVTSTAYGPQVAGTGNNLLPVSVSQGAGDGSLTATAAYGYDAIGNLTSIDGPLAGTADTTTYRYDADRELVGVISPDPDGAGPMLQRARRTTYSAHGIAIETEAGTVNGTADTDWAAFNSLQQLTTTLDAADRKVLDVVTAGGTTYQVAQYSYDSVGRLDCTALRMNSVTWGSLPSSACTLATTGSFGPDRITKNLYDAANHVTQVQTAFGTADQANEATGTYSNNGKVTTLTDAQANTTTYEYDGFDRLVKTDYPLPTAGSGTSSTTDYEHLAYDANSNVTNRRLRDGTSIGYTVDALNRVTYKDLPGTEADVTYGYDNLGRMTSATDASGNYVGNSYDALGRRTAQSSPLGTIQTGYDLAGQRTLMVWPDAFYVTYDHLMTGEVSAIRENGAASGIGVLATYTYDDLGRRTSLTRGNGTTTSYGWDPASRLSSMSLDLAGATYDQTLGFSYNPAGQIAGTTRSNDLYAYTASVDTNSATTVNGLNQTVSSGAATIAYDARGNLASTGTSSYTYSAENHLLTGPVATFTYDPLGRMYHLSASTGDRDFLTYGDHLVGELVGGSLVVRTVFGAGTDEPLVHYAISGGTATRTWLNADERGSIIATTNDTGSVQNINRYDEYGVPAAGYADRFQYTGQAWIREAGLYYYKRRFYSTRLGRFLQTDPIGYGDGMNWYNYVHGDPLNSTDPTGTKTRLCNDGTMQDGCGANGGDAGPDIPVNGQPPATSGTPLNTSGNVTSFPHYSLPSDPPPDGPDIVVTANRQPCSGVLASAASILYKAGGMTAKAGQGAIILGAVIEAGDLTPAAPITAPGGLTVAGFGAIGVGLGTSAQFLAGAYYMFHGNPYPIINAAASLTFGVVKGGGELGHEAMGTALDAGAEAIESGHDPVCGP